MKRLVAALLFLIPNAAWATCSSVPYTFTPNTLAQSGQVNANFAAVVNCANTIDASQIVTGVLPVARGGTNNPTWTTGSVVFATASTQLGQDNANLFWDSTNLRLGIKTNTPTVTLEVNGVTNVDGADGTDGLRVLNTAKTHWFALRPETASGNGQIGYWAGSGWGSTTFEGNVGMGGAVPAFTLDVNGIVSAGQYNIQGRILAASGGTYNNLYDGSANAAIFMGGSGDPENFYRNTSHVFGNIGGSTTYATINASTFTVNVGQSNFNTVSAGNLTANAITSNGNVAGTTFNCSGALGSQCIHSTISGDSINNYTNQVWGFYASGGSPGQIFAGQISSQAPGTAGSGAQTACLVGGWYLTGMSGLTVCASDERLKDVGDPLGDGLSLVDQLKPVNYVWKDQVEKHPKADDALHAGFTAQDVKKIMPQCVGSNPTDGFYSLDNTCLIAYLAKAIQELDAKVSSK